MKAAWITDIHVNFISFPEATAFFGTVVKEKPDVIFLTGDISHASRIELDLRELERVVQRPIFFVLGNHDFWESDIASVENKVKSLSEASSYLRYMSVLGHQRLSDKACVVGHDGWYDMCYGNYKTSTMQLNDWVYTADFINNRNGYVDIEHVVTVSRARAMQGINHIAQQIKEAVRSKFTNIIVLTHVPPFVETCLHNGRPSEPGALPFFSSKLMGDMLLKAAKAYPTIRFTIFCGHTHGAAHMDCDNLHVYTGGAEYRAPEVQPLIMLED